MNSDPPRLLEQLDPPRRREGYWIAGVGVLVALVVGVLLMRSGRGEPIQTTTLASAVVPAKPAPPPAAPPSRDEAATPSVAVPNDAPPPRRSARHASRANSEKTLAEAPVVDVGDPSATANASKKHAAATATATAKPAAKVDPKDEPLPDFPVPPAR